MTGVEWVIQYLNDVKPNQFCSIETIKELLEKANEMDKREEISDQIIRISASQYILTAFNDGLFQAFEQGAKWYREQLKARQ